MCFSATASFALSGVLVPIGVFTIAKARRHAPASVPFAAFPLAFGLQQALEGAVWLGLAADNTGLVAAASRGFLFFSHFFWLAFVPFAVWRLEADPKRKRFLAGLAMLGFVYGLSILLPALFQRGGLEVEVVQRSLEYHTVLIYEGFISRAVLKVFYAIIVVSALALSSNGYIRFFAVMITLSLLLTYVFFAYAFISVWCFFAAGLSLYLVWALPRFEGAATQSARAS